jgi:hypothetical protein
MMREASASRVCSARNDAVSVLPETMSAYQAQASATSMICNGAKRDIVAWATCTNAGEGSADA